MYMRLLWRSGMGKRLFSICEECVPNSLHLRFVSAFQINRKDFGMKGFAHLVWILFGAAVGFLASFLFGDLLTLPVDLYYLVYFSIIILFLVYYARKTSLDVGSMVKRRLVWGVVVGTVLGVAMMRNVLSRPQTAQFSGWMLIWGIFWRGVMYGFVDGLILFAFPWIVAWRAFNAEKKGAAVKIKASLVAYAAIILITTTYHLGYSDFRSSKIIQPNIGSTITSLGTIATANPVASLIAHLFLHISAVIHSPYTDLFLPPHRNAD